MTRYEIAGSLIRAAQKAQRLLATLDPDVVTKTAGSTRRIAVRPHRALPDCNADGTAIENLDQLAVTMGVHRKIVPFYVIDNKNADSTLLELAKKDIIRSNTKDFVRTEAGSRRFNLPNDSFAQRDFRATTRGIKKALEEQRFRAGVNEDKKLMYVRTPAGRRRYGQEIGTLIDTVTGLPVPKLHGPDRVGVPTPMKLSPTKPVRERTTRQSELEAQATTLFDMQFSPNKVKDQVSRKIGKRIKAAVEANPALAKEFEKVKKEQTDYRINSFWERATKYYNNGGDWGTSAGLNDYNMAKWKEKFADKANLPSNDPAFVAVANKYYKVRHINIDGSRQNYYTGLASDFMALWAGTAADSDERAIAFQKRAKMKFGLKDAATEHLPTAYIKLSHSDGPPFSDAQMDTYLDAVYAETQAELKRRNITSVVLSRGMRLPEKSHGLGPKREAIVTVRSQPLSAWTSDPKISRSFAVDNYESRPGDALVGTIEVPASRIWSTAVTGSGCLGESEYIVLGGNDKMHLATPEGHKG